MQVNPLPPPRVYKIVSFNHDDKHAVLHWLIMNMLDDCVLTPSNLAAVDAQGAYRWRMNKKPKDHRVLFERAEDVQMFQLAWAS